MNVPHQLLPVDAILTLKQAYGKAVKELSEDYRRSIIEEATYRVKRQWPEFFRDAYSPSGITER